MSACTEEGLLILLQECPCHQRWGVGVCVLMGGSLAPDQSQLPHLPSPAPTCSAPSILATPIDGDSINVAVTAPTEGQPWTSYTLHVCKWDGSTLGACVADTTCTAVLDTSANPPTSNLNTDCTVIGLDADTQYRVTAVASKPGETSPASQPSDATPQWP